MISSKYVTDIIVQRISIVLVLLMISLVDLGHFEIPAQGTNATRNPTNATSGINAISSNESRASQTTIVIPLGSSEQKVPTGYDPYSVTVSPGAKVIWDNEDIVVHTATSGSPSMPDGKFDTGLVEANRKSNPITMPLQPKEYRYFCTLHPFLTGTITVQREQQLAAQ